MVNLKARMLPLQQWPISSFLFFFFLTSPRLCTRRAIFLAAAARRQHLLRSLQHIPALRRCLLCRALLVRRRQRIEHTCYGAHTFADSPLDHLRTALPVQRRERAERRSARVGVGERKRPASQKILSRQQRFSRQHKHSARLLGVDIVS